MDLVDNLSYSEKENFQVGHSESSCDKRLVLPHHINLPQIRHFLCVSLHETAQILPRKIPTLFPGSLILPHSPILSSLQKMRDPGNKVEILRGKTCATLCILT